MALAALARRVLGNARLKRMARKALQSAPRLHARLQLMMHRAVLPPRALPRRTPLAQLSPRARELYCQLTRARAPTNAPTNAATHAATNAATNPD